jgi:serine/threonine protein kinase/formylglycine-generating enzyme required for sulfatase activity
LNPDPDLFFALLALRGGFISRDDFEECIEYRITDGTKSLRKFLLEGPLEEVHLEALDAEVEERTNPESTEATMLLPSGPGEESLLKLDDLDADLDIPELEAMESKPLPPLPDKEKDRYDFKEELGRGSLGKVILAVDRKLHREVAVKLMREGRDSPLERSRFLREGEVAGRLTHPNVIPVYDLGALGEARLGKLYFTMPCISGQDLAAILEAAAKDEGDTRKTFTLARLLGIFQDVCHAVAYAHDHGVIHRDLKPANIMIGHYGETYVVDWGLAKVVAKTRGPESPDPAPDSTEREALKDAPSARPPDSSPEGHMSPSLTMDGQVLGTPAYMSPEQAKGRVSQVDFRSDIYSLGAILYQILTYRPPFEGATALEVIAKVLTHDVRSPTLAASELQGKAFDKPDASEASFISVPPELEEVCLKALAREREGRFSSAQELAGEIQKYLDGEKTRERLAQLAQEKIAQGNTLVTDLEKQRLELKRLALELEEKTEACKSFWPVEKKRPLWELEAKVKALQGEIVVSFGRVAAAFQEALGFERDNPLARAALADLYWNQYLREEEARDEGQMLYFEGLVRRYNDGEYDAKLKGDGTLSIGVQHYPCHCLREGRLVSPQELAGSVECRVSSVEKGEVHGHDPGVSDGTEHSTPNTRHFSQSGLMGFHPFSGRALDGHEGGEGLPELEPKGPIQLKVHGPDCKTEPLEGADVWLFRYEHSRKILLPVFPKGVVVRHPIGVECGVSSVEKVPEQTLNTLHSTLDTLYEKTSPYRPPKGLYLGSTPIEGVSLPMGSYLVILHKSGFHPVRLHLHIGRLEEQGLNITLYPDIPPGYVQVPAGKFVSHGDLDNPYSGPREIHDIDDFSMAVFPVTCREYLAFLNDPAERDAGRSGPRVPRESAEVGGYWPLGKDGNYAIPTPSWLAAAEEDERCSAQRLVQAPVDWEEDWPVMGISWEDATAYAAWYSQRKGLLACLPHEVMWEKCARGTDGRIFSWGSDFEDTYLNCIRSREGRNRPAPVDSFPVDESPYGAKGMNGNALDWCLNDAEDGRRLLRGGSWLTYGMPLRLTARMAGDPRRIGHGNGFRLAVLLRIPQVISPSNRQS